MARLIVLISLLLISVVHMGAGCQGTETGNPGNAQAGNGSPSTYTNDTFGVEAEYATGWGVTEEDPVGVPEASPVSDGADQPSPMAQGGIDTSESPSTEFSDGTSTVTLYFVTLESEPQSLLGYLNGLFPTRSFEVFVNDFIAGYRYDNPESGTTGGDRQEYYFLNGTTLLYVVTDLFEENDGFEKAETLLDSLRFE